MEKKYSDNLHSIKNTEDLTMKQMFDISEKLISEQSDEIYGVNTINWEDSSWKYLALTGGEKVISLPNTMVSQWNSSGISSQDLPHCSSATKSKSYYQN